MGNKPSKDITPEQRVMRERGIVIGEKIPIVLIAGPFFIKATRMQLTNPKLYKYDLYYYNEVFHSFVTIFLLKPDIKVIQYDCNRNIIKFRFDIELADDELKTQTIEYSFYVSNSSSKLIFYLLPANLLIYHLQQNFWYYIIRRNYEYSTMYIVELKKPRDNYSTFYLDIYDNQYNVVSKIEIKSSKEPSVEYIENEDDDSDSLFIVCDDDGFVQIPITVPTSTVNTDEEAVQITLTKTVYHLSELK